MELVSLLQVVILKPGINIHSSVTSCKSKQKGLELCSAAAILSPPPAPHTGSTPEQAILQEFGPATDVFSCSHTG